MVGAAFRFRYDKLLTYREYLKEKSEIELGASHARLRDSQKKLEQYTDELGQINQELKDRLNNKLSSDSLKNYTDLSTTLKMMITSQDQKVAKATNVIKEKTKILIEKTKQFKVIEKLKEKEFQKWDYQKHLEESKEMNEVAILRHGKDFLQE